MADFHQTTLELLTPDPNGTNKTFLTPTKFVAGTFRLMVNGQLYAAADTNFGWVEDTDQQITITGKAPRVGDCLQGLYRELDISSALGLDEVKGSPFHPSEC